MSNLYTVRTPETVPPFEFNQDFITKMANRMVVSFYKYGKVAEAYPTKCDAIASLEQRLQKYKETGNTEWLVDVAIFAMIEFTHPRMENAHFRSTDSDESPGRVRLDGKDPQASNK